MKVKECMCKQVCFCKPDTKIGEIARMMKQSGIDISKLEDETFDNAIRDRDYATINKFLYRVQSVSESDYWFRLHVETQNDKTPSAKLAKKYYRVKSLKGFYELHPHKVHISVIGKIKEL